MKRTGIQHHKNYKHMANAMKIGRQEISEVIENQKKCFFTGKLPNYKKSRQTSLWQHAAQNILESEKGIEDIKMAAGIHHNNKDYL